MSITSGGLGGAAGRGIRDSLDSGRSDNADINRYNIDRLRNEQPDVRDQGFRDIEREISRDIGAANANKDWGRARTLSSELRSVQRERQKARNESKPKPKKPPVPKPKPKPKPKKPPVPKLKPRLKRPSPKPRKAPPKPPSRLQSHIKNRVREERRRKQEIIDRAVRAQKRRKELFEKFDREERKYQEQQRKERELHERRMENNRKRKELEKKFGRPDTYRPSKDHEPRYNEIGGRGKRKGRRDIIEASFSKSSRKSSKKDRGGGAGGLERKASKRKVSKRDVKKIVSRTKAAVRKSKARAPSRKNRRSRKR